MDFIVKNLTNIIVFALVMSIIVIVHELGHLIAAKHFGVYCKEFAIGMGPKVFTKKSKKSETSYSLRLFPIGGFVSMAGEPGEDDMEDVPYEKTLAGIARWKRMIVLLAGIVMNLILAYVVFLAIFGFKGIVREAKPIIAEVVEGYPAASGGMKANDEIIKMTFYDGKELVPNSFTDVSLGIGTFEANPIVFEVKRSGEIVKVTVTPVQDKETKAYVIGIRSVPNTLERPGFMGLITYTFTYIGTMIGQLVQVLMWLVAGKGLNNVGGPIAIYQATSGVSSMGFEQGFLYFWNLIGSLSISLAVMNLVPIPVFDGGRALITVVEMIIRRPIPKKIENFVMVAGFVMMIAIVVFFVFNDIKKL